MASLSERLRAATRTLSDFYTGEPLRFARAIDEIDTVAGLVFIHGEAVSHAAKIAHHFWWDSPHQEGHTQSDWTRCDAWPCAILAESSGTMSDKK